ncbi:hypothetical protein [Singulisphaera sp. GP187]|uniref:hypothetical protein n=1 Tax=Singulisphaera sp. GP187 TaxID=1882752 RepID=UPI0009F98951|nr:hypothetical protein [Singulisphaera sp. GP187]
MLSGRGDSPQPSADAVALGRSFAPILAGTLADGFDAGAKALASGKTIGESDAILKATFDQGRKAAFDAHAGQAIRDLAPDGTEISDNAKRNALVSLFTGFAKGLRKAK